VVVVLVVTLSSTSSRNAPSPSALAARRSQQGRQELRKRAQVASAVLEAAFKPLQDTLTVDATTERNDSAAGDSAGARKTFLSDATALVHFENVVLNIRFPGSMDADLQSFVTSTINMISTDTQASDPDEDFNAAVTAANRSLTAWANAWSLVRRDLQGIGGRQSAPLQTEPSS
jgi:hypothetical protein